jgi:methyl-accepting chemotaxis protein
LPCPDGGTIKTLSSTFGDQAVATADELKGIFDGAPLHRDATLNGDPAALYAGQIKNYAGQPIAILETIKDTTDYEVAAARSQRNLIFGTVAILIAAGLVALFLGRGISRPLVSITAIMNRLSSDDIDVAIPRGERLDEVGTMAQAVDVFRRSVMEARTLRGALEADKEKNELETRALRRQMADRFESEVKSVVGAVAKATEDMRGVAGEITSSVNDTSDRRSGRRVGRGLGKRRRGCGGDR